jgi:D-alanine-D-alanine ligase
MRIALLYGGRSGEHEISIRSARSIYGVLQQTHSVYPIFIDKQGAWWRAGEKGELPSTRDGLGERVCVFPGVDEPALHTAGARLKIDIAFPILHGTHGEDGIIQGLLESAGIPYVGAGVAASAVGMDKVMMKAMFAQSGLPVPPHLSVLRSEWKEDCPACLESVLSALPFPMFVKPANLGSSVGISKAHDRAELALALDEAARYDAKIIIEKGINAREIECSVLGNRKPKASLPGEIIPRREFYDYVAKYIEDSTELKIPADLSPEQIEKVQDLSVRAFQAIDCSGMGRVDLFLERGTGRLLVNEINTIPGFTSISMYPKLWEASGIDYPTLLNQLLELGLERFAEQSQNLTSYDMIGNP